MITEAVILMAGIGSRLGGAGRSTAKPFVPIAGRPLISYAIDSFERAGVRTLHAVVGDNGDKLTAELQRLMPAGMRLNPIANPEWRKQNGISVLCTAGKVVAPFFLVMGDHLFEYSILEELVARADLRSLNLAVDKKINSIFDLDDAMKVQTKDGRVTAIGKDLSDYDSIDTGVFLSPEEIFDYLRRSIQGDDCSLADGVRGMARDGKVRAVDIGDASWQDVDTPGMLQRAEEEAIRLHRAGRGGSGARAGEYLAG